MIFRTLLLLLVFICQSFAQKNFSPNSHLEIIPPIKEKGSSDNIQATIEKTYPSVLEVLNYVSTYQSPRDIAIDFLKNQGFKLGISDVDNTLQFKSLRKTLSGYRVRFQQLYKGYPVYQASVVVCINNSNKVVFISNGYLAGIKKEIIPVISTNQAIAISRNHLELIEEPKYLKTEMSIFRNADVTYLVNLVRFVSSAKNYADWEFLVDAETGEIIQAKDRSCYYKGYVFDPDPITRSGAVYGDSGFVDANDEDSEQLFNNLRNVDLLNLTFENSQYYLKSEYAQIVDSENPHTGLHGQDSINFQFTRSQNSFEAVNAFYHIDKSMRYVNDTLGISLMPYQYYGGVKFDPHGLGGEDNSRYSVNTGELAFGDGNVDDAEDHDVIVHELCHGLHDWITNGGISNVQGLSEGSCDYWAQSYKRSKGILSNTDHNYNWIFSWDGHNEFWSGRISDFDGHYPEDLRGSIHIQGQLWSSSLMEIYDQIGKYTTDVLFLECLSILNSTSNQVDAALAFIQADKELFEGDHLGVILPVFEARGYISGQIIAQFEADKTGGSYPLHVGFSNNSFSAQPIISWEWDFQNDGIIDSYEENPQHIYEEPGLYTVSLTISNETAAAADTVVDYISANSGIFVWEGKKHQQDNSGSYIFDILNSFSLSAVYSNSNKLPGSFVGYDAVFLSFGNHANSVPLTDNMVQAIKEYLRTGGKVFIEGADVFADRSGDEEFLGLFGISSVNDGQAWIVSSLKGQPLSIFEEMHFTNSNQHRNYSIDHFEPGQSCIAAFSESGYGNVAVQSLGEHGQKTVVFSYAMAELIDNRLPATREDFLVRILKYFEISVPLVPRFVVNQLTGHAPLTLNFLDYSFYNPGSTISYKWDFDNDGTFDSEVPNPQYIIKEPGHYSVRLRIAENSHFVDIIYHDYIKIFNGESALNFNDENSYVKIEADPSLNITSSFTLEFWFNPADWGPLSIGYGRVFDKQNFLVYLVKEGLTNSNEHCLQINILNQSGITSIYSTPDSSINLNSWQHVAITYQGSGSDLKIFIDNEEVSLTPGSVVLSGSVADNSAYPLYFGNSASSSRPFRGSIDEIRLWNISLSAEQISVNRLNYVSPSLSNLLGYWRFNEGFGENLIDQSRSGNNGLISNAGWIEGPDVLQPVVRPNQNNSDDGFVLYTNYPNPYNSETTIVYQLPYTAHVQITIFNILGQSVKTIIDKAVKQGLNEAKFNAAGFSSGVYIYQIVARNSSGVMFKDQKKMILIR